MDLESLPAELRTRVRDELDAGESVRWVGRAGVSQAVIGAIPVAFFGVFFAGFAAFWIVGAYQMTQKHKEFDREWNDTRAQMNRDWNQVQTRTERDPWGAPAPQPAPQRPPTRKPESDFSFGDLFPCFGILFLVVGLGMVFSPVWAAYRASTTVYLVTDRRAVIFAGGWSTHVRSFGPADLGHVERRERGDGSGDLILAKEPEYVPGYYSGTPGKGGHYVPGRWTTREIGFFGIAQVKYVERLVREVAARGPAPTA